MLFFAMESAASHSDSRAEVLLVQHCQALDERRAPAYSRLAKGLEPFTAQYTGAKIPRRKRERRRACLMSGL